MDNRTEDNNTLYFIVGGLVVVAFIFGFIWFNNRAEDGVTSLAPAAGGYETPVDRNETNLNIFDRDNDGEVELEGALDRDDDGEVEINGSITTDQ